MPESSTSPERGGPRRRTWAVGVLIGVLACAVFAHDLTAEPEFPDEWAYVSQAHYLDLLARPDDPLWLEYPAYDLPPLPKYLIGLALVATGHERPPPAAARAWYLDVHDRCGPHALLLAARWPSVTLGVLGVVAAFALGTLGASDRRVGVLAALLLMLDPLYRMHARRAMSDVPAEALMLLALALGLAGWRVLLSRGERTGRGVAALLMAGVSAGLAVLAKLNGGLALMVLGAWAVLGAALPGVPWRRKTVLLAATAGAGALAYATFLPLNPFLWSDPSPPLPRDLATLAQADVIQRTRFLIDHRDAVSRNARTIFPHDALESPAEKVAAVAIQGGGRYGPFGRKRLVPDRYEPETLVAGFDSTIRYDWTQDAGALVWLPLVLTGALVLARLGRSQQRAEEPPAAWALLVQAIVVIGTVTAYIPMAWDRYYLSIQAPTCLLGATALVAAGDALARRLRRRLRPES